MQLFTKVKRSDPKMLPENGLILAWNSHSVILQSVTCQQGVVYRHIILLALSLKFPEK